MSDLPPAVVEAIDRYRAAIVPWVKCELLDEVNAAHAALVAAIADAIEQARREGPDVPTLPDPIFTKVTR